MRRSAVGNSVLLLVFTLSLAGCAAGSGGTGAGGVVIDSPDKLFEGVITGHITHQGEPVEGATVRIKGYEFSDTTDADGRFRLEFRGTAKMGVGKKRLQIEASAENLRTRVKGVYLEQRRITNIDIELLEKY